MTRELCLPRRAVLVFEKGALPHVLHKRAQLELKDPVHHVRAVLPRLPGLQRSSDLPPVRVACEGDKEGGLTQRVRHCSGVLNQGIIIPDRKGVLACVGVWRVACS